MVGRCGEPVLPHRDTAITITIDMAIGIAGYPTVHLERFGLNKRIVAAYLHADGKFGDRAISCGRRSLHNQKAAFDQEMRLIQADVQLGLIEGNRSL